MLILLEIHQRPSSEPAHSPMFTNAKFSVPNAERKGQCEYNCQEVRRNFWGDKGQSILEAESRICWLEQTPVEARVAFLPLGDSGVNGIVSHVLVRVSRGKGINAKE